MSDLHDLFKRELQEIRLPPAETWFSRPTRGSPTRSGAGWITAALVTVLVLVGAVGAGRVISLFRERAEPSTVASGLPLMTPGEDLVYVAENDVGRGGLQIVSMPSGNVVGRSVLRSVVGTDFDRDVMWTAPDFGLFPVWQDGGRAPGTADTYLQAMNLATGVPTFRISTGPVHTGTAAGPGLEVAGPFVGEAAVADDGSSAYFVRDTGTNGAITEVTRYDASHDPGTNTPSARTGTVIASRQWAGADPERSIWARIIPLGASHVALVRQQVDPKLRTPVAQDWHFLDSDLREIRSYAGAQRFAPICSFDVLRTPGGEWALVCGDAFGFATENVVYFLDGRDFHVVATVRLPRELGYPLGSAITAEGTLGILTDRPLVVRIDSATHQVVDKRPVTGSRSFFEEILGLSVALAKVSSAPTIQFTRDGRFAYVATDRSLWWGGVALIDLAEARVVTHSTDVGDTVLALRIGEGNRLYALSTDRPGQTTLALLDAATLAVLHRSVPLAHEPTAIVAAVPRR